MWNDFTCRRSGKSTRMAEHILNYILTTPNKTIIVTKNRYMFEHVVDMVLSIFSKCTLCTCVEDYTSFKKDLMQRARYSHKMIPFIRNYVDEVQFIKDKYLFVDNDNYYTGTLYEDYNGIRTYCETPFMRKFTRSEKIDRFLSSDPCPELSEFLDGTAS